MTLADDRPAPLRELALIAALWAAYSLGRLAADGHVVTAMANASRVWDLERLLRLPGETGVQHLLLRSGTVIEAANSYYAYVHFPATIAFLIWVYLRRPGSSSARASTAPPAPTASPTSTRPCRPCTWAGPCWWRSR